MTIEKKLEMVKAILRITDDSEDALLLVYLEAAKNELLGWRYSYTAVSPEDVPFEYEMTQIYAVVNGYTQSGAEGQTVSVENGIQRHFSYPDMVNYIRSNVIAIAGIPGTLTGGTPYQDVYDKVFSDVIDYLDENVLEINGSDGE